MDKNNGGVSLASLNMVKASEAPFEFEYVTPEGRQTGIFFKVLGGQSEIVTKAAAKMINERRRQVAAKEINKQRGGHKQVDYEPFENDVEFGQRLAAVRLVGWSGITDAYTPENALRLCQTNKFIAAAVLEYSDDISNFTNL